MIQSGASVATIAHVLTYPMNTVYTCKSVYVCMYVCMCVCVYIYAYI